ncbi:hypothetical protein EGW08_002238, partial [Elysia chlorotica]
MSCYVNIFTVTVNSFKQAGRKSFVDLRVLLLPQELCTLVGSCVACVTMNCKSRKYNTVRLVIGDSYTSTMVWTRCIPAFRATVSVRRPRERMTRNLHAVSNNDLPALKSWLEQFLPESFM